MRGIVRVVSTGTAAGSDRSNSFIKLKRLLNSLTIVVLIYFSTWFVTVTTLLVAQVREGLEGGLEGTIPVLGP